MSNEILDRGRNFELHAEV